MPPTETQLMYYEEYKRLGSMRKAADALGRNYSTIRSAVKRCESMGMPVLTDRSSPHIRLGYQTGKSTQHIVYKPGDDGEMVSSVVQEWLRSAPGEDSVEVVAEFLKERIPVTKLTLPAVENYDPDIMLQIDLADIHYGLHAWRHETGGDDYDIKITQQLVRGTMAEIFARAGKVAETLLVLYGDNFHADFFNALTEGSKHYLDTDGRYPKVILTGAETYISAVEYAAQFSDKVRVIVLYGNHDKQTSINLQVILHVHFSLKYPGVVTIDLEPSKTRYHVWGVTAQNFHHGDGSKPDRLCADVQHYVATRDIIGVREFRANQAHLHREESKDINGVIYECKPSPVAPDAFAAGAKFNSKRAAIASLFHKAYGMVSRYIVTPRQLTMRRDRERLTGVQ